MITIKVNKVSIWPGDSGHPVVTVKWQDDKGTDHEAVCCHVWHECGHTWEEISCTCGQNASTKVDDCCWNSSQEGPPLEGQLKPDHEFLIWLMNQAWKFMVY